MKQVIAYLIVLELGIGCSFAQLKFWGDLKPGPHRVGYQDTTVFNSNQAYSYGDYQGPKPFFVSIWFPTDSKAGSPMTYGDYFHLDKNKTISTLIDSMTAFQNESFMGYGILSNFDTWANDPKTTDNINLFEAVLNEKVYSTKIKQLPTPRYPTIIYHHGMGSIASDNSVLCEYLASHGYIVISAQYHWPNLLTKQFTQQGQYALDDVKFIVKFAKGLNCVDSRNIFYIGHSWGGGVGIKLNCIGVRDFKRYFIFDSTIEHYGLEEMTFTYPNLDSVIRFKGSDFKTPTTVFTARGSYYENGKLVIQPFPQFLPYKLINKDSLTLYTFGPVLNHGAFTSTPLVRITLSNRFPQIDSSTVLPQFKVYQELLLIMNDILAGKNTNSKLITKYEFKD